MKILTVLLITMLISTNSFASVCVVIDENGYLKNSGVSIESCNTMILLDANEYKSINVDSIISTLNDLFAFSAEDFSYFVGTCLVTFITGHSTGRITRLLGRT